MQADLGTVLGLEGDAFEVFLRAELGQIKRLFWGSKGVVHLGFSLRLN
jgi:hypothetical protein